MLYKLPRVAYPSDAWILRGSLKSKPFPAAYLKTDYKYVSCHLTGFNSSFLHIVRILSRFNGLLLQHFTDQETDLSGSSAGTISSEYCGNHFNLPRMGQPSTCSRNFIGLKPIYRYLHFFSILVTALGSGPPVANPDINPQSRPLTILNTSDTFPSILLTSNPHNDSHREDGLDLDDDVYLSNETSVILKCDGSKFGYDLNKTSCIDAWASIPIDDEIVTYGVRYQGQFEALLPIRYLSPNGQCAIDITQKQNVISDRARNVDISAAANVLLENCVIRTTSRAKRSIGGTLAGIDFGGGLSVKLRSYTPDVECVAEPSFDNYEACSEVLSMLYVSFKPLVFTHDEQRALPFNVIIPPGGMNFTAGGRSSCTATISLVDEVKDTGTWFQLWEGAAAVTEMCVRRGKAGISFGNGHDGHLTVTLGS